MKTISFTDIEAKELVAFYQHKLVEAEKRLENIQGILQRLAEANLLDTEVIESPGDMPADDLPEIIMETSMADDEGIDVQEAALTDEDVDIITTSAPALDELDLDISKYNWLEFVKTTLDHHATVYTMAEIVDLGISCYNLNKEERGKISKKITPFFTHLLKNDEIRKFNIQGQNGYYYGLADWFLKNGRVKKPYIARFTAEGRKAKKRRRYHENDLQDFVTHHLTEHRRLMTFEDLLTAAKVEFGFPESDRPIFIHNFKDEIGRMQAVNQLLDYTVPGIDEVFYALPSWFKTNGEIRKPFVHWK